MKKLKALFVILTIVLIIAVMCSQITGCTNSRKLIIASTTSTQDSGLFDVLIPAFEKNSGYNVKVIAIGTGEAIEYGKRGEADIILVHSKIDEDKFMQEGFGLIKKDVMYNEFIIVGPKEDPAKIKGMKEAVDAFLSIAKSESIFVSRGDGSGTNKKELLIWEKVGFKPSGDNYIETGQGMAETLKIADEKQGYTITDNATWYSLKENLDLDELLSGDEILFNPYSVIAVNPEKHPNLNLNYKGAVEFINWITSKEGQEIIKNFGLSQYERPLFYPVN